MSPPPIDPRQLDRDDDDLEVAERLERTARAATEAPPPDLADRVMSAIAEEPAPRRSFGARLAALLSGGSTGRLARAGVSAAALVLVVGGVLAASELARMITDHSGVGTTPSPAILTPLPTPSSTEVPAITPHPSEAPPTPAEQESTSPEPSTTSEATVGPSGSASSSPHESDSEDGHSASGTPQPTETPGPSGGGDG